MPSLAQALGASTTQVLWIIDIYPLLMAGLLVPKGTIRHTFEEDDERAMALTSGTRIRKSPSQSTIEMGYINGGGGGI